jgi:hypothetical protein
VRQEFLTYVTKLVKDSQEGKLKTFPGYEELAKKFSIGSVRNWLKELPDDIAKQRTAIMQKERADRLSKLRSEPFEETKKEFLLFAREELEMLKQGKIKHVLTMNELAQKFETGTHAIFNWIKELSEEEQALRLSRSRDLQWKRLSDKKRLPYQKARKAFIAKVREELRLHREGIISELSTIDDWQRREGLGRKSVFNWLKDLSEKDQAYRNLHTYHQGRSRARDSRRGEIHFNGMDYDSIQEAAIAELLKQYVYGFEIENGKTFQLPVGIDGSIDFKIGNTYIEWHPITFWDFEKSNLTYGDYKAASTQEEKNALKAKVAEDYAERRKDLIREELKNRDFEFLHIKNINEFYEKVLRPYGRDIPPAAEVLRRFLDLQQEIRGENRD